MIYHVYLSHSKPSPMAPARRILPPWWRGPPGKARNHENPWVMQRTSITYHLQSYRSDAIYVWIAIQVVLHSNPGSFLCRWVLDIVSGILHDCQTYQAANENLRMKSDPASAPCLWAWRKDQEIWQIDTNGWIASARVTYWSSCLHSWWHHIRRLCSASKISHLETYHKPCQKNTRAYSFSVWMFQSLRTDSRAWRCIGAAN